MLDFQTIKIFRTLMIFNPLTSFVLLFRALILTLTS